MRFDPGVLFGLFLLVAGTSIVLNGLFKIDLPLLRVFLGTLLVYAGGGIVLSGFGVRIRGFENPPGAMVFASGEIEQVAGAARGEHSIVFGSGTVDVTAAAPSNPDPVVVNAIFGTGVVRYDPSQALEVQASSAFGATTLPDGRTITFGDAAWRSPAAADGPTVRVKTSSVFGTLRFEPVGQPTASR